MSYFGNQGPAQDGGFISGIARGNARLHNARVTRARYQKGIGAVRDYIPMANDFPDDAILKSRAENFLQSYEQSDGYKNKSMQEELVQIWQTHYSSNTRGTDN